ncbi:MAG: ankyrin repeat domain-containing protein [Gemmatimonadales bacterium]
MAEIARQLLALGADPNTRFPWEHHGVHRPVLWGAALATRSLPLVQLLLEAGADPNDGVTLVIAASAADIPLLDLLHAHGARADQPWATDGSTALYAILGWSRRFEGALWLLDHGADPNAVFPANGETPFHAAARVGHLPLAESMLAHGGGVDVRRTDGKTPYAIAELSGNREMAAWLLAHGASGDLEEADQLTALCSRGDRAGAEAFLGAHRTVVRQLGEDHYTAFHQVAESGDLRALEAFLAAGFDPNRPDASIGKTVLHSAAMAGRAEAVRLLLSCGASVAVRDREFNGQPLVWAAEGSRSHGEASGEYAAVGRLLLAAGSPVEWEGSAEPSEGILEIVDGWRQPAS